MNDLGQSDSPPVLNRLQRVLSNWVEKGESATLERWLASELEPDGAPVHLAIPDWWQCLWRLAEARQRRPGWTKEIDRRALALLRSALRFSRPVGTPTMQFAAKKLDAQSLSFLSDIVGAYGRSGEARVIRWYLSLPDGEHVPPPLPAWSSTRHVLAVLRGGWKKGDDLLVVDHRCRGHETRFELMGAGCSWLGPDWRLAAPAAAPSPASPGSWISNSVADLVEWSCKSTGLRFTRTALLLRGRKLALLGDQVDGASLPGQLLETEFGFPDGITAEPISGSRALLLRSSGSRSSAQVLPIALPAGDYKTERGHFGLVDQASRLGLSQTAAGKRCWLPLLVSWDAGRHRKRLSWRVLTVVENSQVCSADVAFAVRVSWGRDETLVIYRSLGAPAPRSFLGYQTKSRFLVGRFTSDGTVEPWISLD